MSFLKDKKFLIVGVANKFSIAAGISQSMAAQGADLFLSYQNERLLKKVTSVGDPLGCVNYFECDVSDDNSIDLLMEAIENKWGYLDGIVHAVGFAPTNELDGNFVDVATREGFKIAHDISVFSFTALAQKAKHLMKGRNGALLTLSYLGAQRTLPNYNVMGVAKAALESTTRYLANSLGADQIRVNAISAGPVKTLAASGVKVLKRCFLIMNPERLLKETLQQKRLEMLLLFSALI